MSEMSGICDLRLDWQPCASFDNQSEITIQYKRVQAPFREAHHVIDTLSVLGIN